MPRDRLHSLEGHEPPRTLKEWRAEQHSRTKARKKALWEARVKAEGERKASKRALKELL